MRISDWSSDVCSSDLRVARPRAGGDVGDDRIGLCKREQNRVAEERLAAAEKLRHAAVAAREPFGPGGVDAREFGFQCGAMLFARRIEKFEFEQVAKPVDPGPESVGRIAAEIGRASGRGRVCQYV